MNLTRRSFFNLLISPVFMRAANATQSESVTPQNFASITKLSASNSLLPNLTFAMEHVYAAVRSTPHLQKMRATIPRVATQAAAAAAAAVGVRPPRFSHS